MNKERKDQVFESHSSHQQSTMRDTQYQPNPALIEASGSSTGEESGQHGVLLKAPSLSFVNDLPLVTQTDAKGMTQNKMHLGRRPLT